MGCSSVDSGLAYDGAAVSGMVQRVLLILECLADAGEGLGVSEIARRTALPKSTAYRLLQALMHCRAVERAGNRYRHGELARHLSKAGDGSRFADLRRIISPYLLELSNATHQVISLAVLRAPDVVYIESLYERKDFALIRRSARILPAHCTAAGKLLLSFDADSADSYLRDHPLTRYTRSTITEVGMLESEFWTIRRSGIAYSREEYLEGFLGIAVPVFDWRGRALFAISAAGSVDTLSPAAVEFQLRAAGRNASQAIRGLRHEHS